jgi:hypothetical protein
MLAYPRAGSQSRLGIALSRPPLNSRIGVESMYMYTHMHVPEQVFIGCRHIAHPTPTCCSCGLQRAAISSSAG